MASLVGPIRLSHEEECSLKCRALEVAGIVSAASDQGKVVAALQRALNVVVHDLDGPALVVHKLQVAEDVIGGDARLAGAELVLVELEVAADDVRGDWGVDECRVVAFELQVA